MAYGLTRIVQEALTNAAKHAQPSQITVSLQCPGPNTLTCVIADDGKGFTPQELMAEIDAIYRDRENIRLPVVAVYDFVQEKLRGGMTKDQQTLRLLQLRYAVSGIN